MPKATGRTIYTPELAKTAAALCKLGATNAEIANGLGVACSTVELWMVKHPEFGAAVKTAKAVADARVERSLYQRACGYECDEIDIRVVGSQVVQTPIRKRYPPDVVACIFWLKNRRPDLWREKRDGVDDLTPEAAAREAQEAVQRAMSTSAATG